MSFRQPVLTGPSIRLRPLRAGDRAALAAAASDPAIWAQHPEPDRFRDPAFSRYFEGGLASGGALAIEEAATGRVIGSSRYANHDPAARAVEIGWTFLTRDHWGGATNGELKRLMLDHAFGHVDAVLFQVGDRNLRSRRAVEKLGAVPAGTGREGHVVYRLHVDVWRVRP
jgi:RimJ/RimL family protein N-acetyltransferase